MALYGSLNRTAGFWCLAAGLVLSACSHPEPFQADNPPFDTTFGGGARLTFNLGTDLRPGWLPDGSAVIYSYENLSDTLLDRCLAVLPRSGGTRKDLPCAQTYASRDSVDAFSEATPGPNGAMLFIREWSIANLLTPIRGALQVSPVDRPDSAVTLFTYPYTAPNGNLHQGVDQIRWMSPTTAVYLATGVTYPRPCGNCVADTVRTGIELVEVNIPGKFIQPIPNTDGASSVAVGESGDEIFFTRNGDSRVFLLIPSTGSLSVAHDFGSLGIARDISLRGNRLVAVVGGAVSYFIDPSTGPSQPDHGGDIWTADLTTGNQVGSPVTDRLFRHPALSPAGNRIVAESFAVVLTQVSRSSDLWLFNLP